MKNQENKIKVLHIVGSMYPGGMENFIMNIYENIDKESFQFDFAENVIRENGYDNRIKELGGKVFVLPRLTKHPISNLKMLKELINNEKYDIVVRHTANALVVPQLWVSKRAGAISVCHSHSTTDPMKLIHYIGRLFMKRSCNYLVACSDAAGRWMYGNNQFSIIKNGIDVDKFSFSETDRNKIIEEFGIQNKHIFGHIGNYLEVKNHSFLLDIFKEISKRDEDAVLICVGEGDKRLEIEQKIKDLGLEDRVILTGIRKDVNAFLSSFDVLIFPSIFEGLPLSLIEAQISGVPIVMSDTITDDVCVTDGLVSKLSINTDASKWAEHILNIQNNLPDRKCQIESIREHGYDLSKLVKDYEDFLRSII